MPGCHISIGQSSIIGDRLGLKLDSVTESGFAADM